MKLLKRLDQELTIECAAPIKVPQQPHKGKLDAPLHCARIPGNAPPPRPSVQRSSIQCLTVPHRLGPLPPAAKHAARTSEAGT
ncbi:hypothetical protein BH23GEM9_BH23GEM9_12690 [soil metagenome]